jgi:hypothetical protein
MPYSRCVTSKQRLPSKERADDLVNSKREPLVCFLEQHQMSQPLNDRWSELCAKSPLVFQKTNVLFMRIEPSADML